MKNVQKQKRANKSLPFFFRDEFKVSFVIIFISLALLITTFTFDIVPPILNRGIQPATFPKALLVLIIVMTLLIYYLATKNPWKVQKKLPKSFFLTLLSFFIFVLISFCMNFFCSLLRVLLSFVLSLSILCRSWFRSFCNYSIRFISAHLSLFCI